MILKKTYRFEGNVSEQITTNYILEKKYVREVDIYLLDYKKSLYQYQVLTVDFDFSDEDNAMGKFLRQISSLFDEIEMAVDKDGNIVEINNIQFLRLRWIKIQAKLAKSHQGHAIENYFNQITNLLEDKQSVISFLQEYNMFGLLFNGLWNAFEKQRRRTTDDGHVEIMTPIQDGDKIIQTITLENTEQKEENNFRGLFIYKGINYEEGYVEVKKNKYHFKHSLLWIG